MVPSICMEGCWLQNQNEFESELKCFHLQLKIVRQWVHSLRCVSASLLVGYSVQKDKQAQLVHGMAWEKLPCEVGCLTFCGGITFIQRHSVLVPWLSLCTQCRILFPVFLFSCMCSFKVHIYDNNKTSKVGLCDACFYWLQVCVLNLLSCLLYIYIAALFDK